jgi:hypothetical protein
VAVVGLWDEMDGFYYDTMRDNGVSTVIRVRSLVGLVSLFSAYVLDMKRFGQLQAFRQKLNWIVANRPFQARQVSFATDFFCYFNTGLMY